jgi:hypothetical protein
MGWVDGWGNPGRDKRVEDITRQQIADYIYNEDVGNVNKRGFLATITPLDRESGLIKTRPRLIPRMEGVEGRRLTRQLVGVSTTASPNLP